MPTVIPKVDTELHINGTLKMVLLQTCGSGRVELGRVKIFWKSRRVG